MNVVAVEWDENDIPLKVMMIAQDIGKRHELENLSMNGISAAFCIRRSSKSSPLSSTILIWIILNRSMILTDTTQGTNC